MSSHARVRFPSGTERVVEVMDKSLLGELKIVFRRDEEGESHLRWVPKNWVLEELDGDPDAPAS